MENRNGTVTMLTVGGHSPESVEQELERVLGSKAFRTALVLRSFLRFITEQTLAGLETSINEYTIATEVFGRAPDFDPAMDTIVRTQAYRLRLKLREYYGSEGAEDPLVIEVPKGHYVPKFLAREALEEPIESRPREKAKLRIVVIVASCVLLFSAGLFSGRVVGVLSSPKSTAPVGASGVDTFWRSFIASDKQPIIAYTNTLHVVTGAEQLIPIPDGPAGDRGAVVDRQFPEVRGPTYFEDDLTGVGEVLGAVAVSNVLNRVGAQPTLKRGRLLTTYDLEMHNVIFLGSPFVNRILDDLPSQPNFFFSRATTPPLLWSSKIINRRPEAGEQPSYAIERASEGQVIRADYGVVVCLPGLRAGKKTLILAGLTTSGTSAAAQFATTAEGVSEMRRRLRDGGAATDKSWPDYFEYLLRVPLSHGVDVVRAECLASRSKYW